MNNKITFPDLVDAVAIAANTSKRVSELFLKELFAVISETLEKGENVKVKNFGTFKVVTVDARKSVNVNTGEEIEIPSHRKVSFSPEKSFAEALNMPFESFETIVLSDDLSEDDLKLLMSTDDDNLNDKAETADVADTHDEGCELQPVEQPVAEDEEPKSEMETTVAQDEQDDVADTEPQPPTVIPDGEDESELETEQTNITPPPFNIVQVPPPFNEEAVEETIDNKEKQDMGVFGRLEDEETEEQRTERLRREEEKNVRREAEAEELTEEYENERFEERMSRNRNASFGRGFMWGVIAAVVVCGVALYCVYAHYSDKVATLESQNLVAAQSVEEQPVVEKNIQEAVDTVVTKPAEPIKEEKVVSAEPIKVDTSVKTDTVRVKYFLTKMAVKYYGKSIFWVYIYEENKTKLNNPNTISPGTVVVIPPAEKYKIDSKNPKSVDEAQKKSYEILKRYE